MLKKNFALVAFIFICFLLVAMIFFDDEESSSDNSNNEIIGSINPTKIINTVFGARKNSN